MKAPFHLQTNGGLAIINYTVPAGKYLVARLHAHNGAAITIDGKMAVFSSSSDERIFFDELPGVVIPPGTALVLTPGASVTYPRAIVSGFLFDL